MKSKLFFTTLFALIFASMLLDGNHATTNNPCILDNTKYVEALIFDGEIFPHIKLPAIEITGDRKN